jgi:hypothetical protein
MVLRGPWLGRRRHHRQPTPPLPPTLQTRLRHLIDRYQVLCLTHPLVAAWLLDWLDTFIGKHLD